jgi:hypothetical protein
MASTAVGVVLAAALLLLANNTGGMSQEARGSMPCMVLQLSLPDGAAGLLGVW